MLGQSVCRLHRHAEVGGNTAICHRNVSFPLQSGSSEQWSTIVRTTRNLIRLVLPNIIGAVDGQLLKHLLMVKGKNLVLSSQPFMHPLAIRSFFCV